MRLTALLALSSCTSRDEVLRGFGVEDREVLVMQLLERAKMLFGRLFEKASLDIVQGLVLIACCEDLRFGKSSKAMLYIGRCFGFTLL